ncbi:hypothetical protein [Nocardia sp. NPDC003726]|uniref:Uncharacterized protein n=1 Tax=Nocardia implantans TaxID=3108168 RepID=A0ABU6B3N6_9NOCA|nr:hypothetical protein [Nocardia beijingensis]MEB3514336.1 hypothetical protein [Nocardia sp. CDC186]
MRLQDSIEAPAAGVPGLVAMLDVFTDSTADQRPPTDRPMRLRFRRRAPTESHDLWSPHA